MSELETALLEFCERPGFRPGKAQRADIAARLDSINLEIARKQRLRLEGGGGGGLRRLTDVQVLAELAERDLGMIDGRPWNG